MQSAHAKIPLISYTFYQEQLTKLELTNKIMELSKLSMGDNCILFEKNFCEWQGRDHSILVNSGSSANLALIQAMLNLGWLKKGDRVGFSALTWATNVMPLVQLGLRPVPIDVEIETLNVSLNNLKKISNLKALFITNLLGLCHDLDDITEYCGERDIYLLEDNCESLGSVYNETKLGNFGTASTFSFYVGHQMSTIEGGMICTDNQELSDMLRMVRAHGWKRDINDFKNDFYGRYTFYDLGYNLRPTEITGILGNIQLKYLDETTQKRNDNFNYIREIYFHEGIYHYETDHMDKFASFSFPIVAKTKELREKLLNKLEDLFETRPIVGGNITTQPFFKKYVGEYNMPNATLIHENGFYIGNNPDLTYKQLDLVKESICKQ